MEREKNSREGRARHEECANNNAYTINKYADVIDVVGAFLMASLRDVDEIRFTRTGRGCAVEANTAGN